MNRTQSRRRALARLTLCIAGLLVAGAGEPAGAKAEFTVAMLQMAPAKDDVAANLDKAERFCRQAAARGADVALMPEMWSIGYTPFAPEQPGAREAFFQKAIKKDGPEIQRFSGLARELDMAIGITYMEAFTPAPRNSITLFDRHGKEVFTYAKVHTCDARHMEICMTPGEAFCVGALDTRGGTVKVGAMICLDRELPESARILMLNGAEIVLTPNASKLDELRLSQFRIRAWENMLGVAMTNYPAPDQDGHSVAYDAFGRCLALADDKEGIYLASFDLDLLRQQRATTNRGNAFRRPHRYGALVSPERSPEWNRTDGNGLPYDPSVR